MFRAQASNSQTAPSLGAEQNGAGKEAVATSVPQHLESEGDEPRKEKPSRINLIPKSRWADGIPPVMGAHLMPSGQATPMSMSKGASFHPLWLSAKHPRLPILGWRRDKARCMQQSMHVHLASTSLAQADLG